MYKAKVITEAKTNPKPQVKLIWGTREQAEKAVNDFINEKWGTHTINSIGWSSAADASSHTAYIIYRPNE